MAKWKHLRLVVGMEFIEIFPANRVDLNWLYGRFPKTKKDNRNSDNSRLIIDVKDNILFVEEAILCFLEENGWEAYAFYPTYIDYHHHHELNITAFKRKEE